MGKIYNIDLCEVENMLNSIDRVTRTLGEGAMDMCDTISAMDDSVYAGSDADAVRDGMNNMTCNIIPKLAGNYETMRGYLYDYYDRLRDAKQNANGFGLTLGVSASGTTTGLIKCDFDAVSNVSSLCTQIEEVCLDFESRINNIIDYASGLRHEDGTKIVNLMNQFGTVNSKVMKFMDTNRNNIVTYATKYVSADDDLKTATALFLSTLHHNVSDLETVKRSIGKFAALGMVRNINRNGAVITLSEIDDPEIGELVEGKTIDDTVPIDTNALFNTIFKLLVKDSLTEEEKALLEECYLQVEMYGLEEALWDSFHIYYLQMYAQLRKEYPFGTQQNMDFFAKMWTWSVKYNNQEIMQGIINLVSSRVVVRTAMLSYIDSEEAGKAYYTWVRICNTDLPEGYKWVVIPSTVQLGCCYMGMVDASGNQSVVFEYMDMNKVIGTDVINYMKNEMSMSKEEITAILSCIGTNFDEDVANIKKLFSIKLGDTQSYAKYFEECYVTDQISQLLTLYLYDVIDWRNNDLSNAMACVNGILTIRRSDNGDDKKVGLLQEIESGCNELYIASILNAVQNNTQENRNMVDCIEYLGGSISALTYFFETSVYTYDPKNCSIVKWNYNSDSNSGYMTFLHTTCATEYVEAISIEDVQQLEYDNKIHTDTWLELRASGSISSRGANAGRNAVLTAGGLITKEVGKVSIGAIFSVVHGVYNCVKDLTYNPSDEMSENELNTIIDCFGVRYVASYSCSEGGDKPSYMMEEYAIDGANSVNAVVFRSEISLGAALLYKELFENGTREIAPLEPGDDWIYNSDCADIEVGENWDLIYFEEKLDAYISNAVGTDYDFAIENKDILRSVYSGGFDFVEYIAAHRSGGDDGEWTQFEELINVYGKIVGSRNDILYVRLKLEESCV